MVQRIRNVGWFIDCNRRPKLADDRAIRYDGSTLIPDAHGTSAHRRKTAPKLPVGQATLSGSTVARTNDLAEPLAQNDQETD